MTKFKVRDQIYAPLLIQGILILSSQFIRSVMMIHRITPRIQAQPLAIAYGRGAICLANLTYLFFFLLLPALLVSLVLSTYGCALLFQPYCLLSIVHRVFYSLW